MNIKKIFMSLLLSSSFSYLYSYSIMQSIMWACGSRGGQELTDVARADSETPFIPSTFMYAKLDENLQLQLEQAYPGLIFRKEEGNTVRGWRNIIYIGKEWENALLAPETSKQAFSLLNKTIRYFYKMNASGFYNAKFTTKVVADVGTGFTVWKIFPKYQHCFKGQFKIAIMTSIGGCIVNNLIHYIYDDAYETFIEEKPESQWTEKNT